VRESNFRGTYNAVILAIHRSGERIQSKVGDVVFHVGDTLLVLAEKEFSAGGTTRGISPCLRTGGSALETQLQSSIVVGVVLAMILAATIEVIRW